MYQPRIIEAHLERCPWRERGSDGKHMRLLSLTYFLLEKVYRIPHENLTISALNNRLNSLERLPEYQISTIPEYNVDSVADLIPQNKVFNRALFVLALYGWQGSKATDDKLQFPECPDCFRKIVLKKQDINKIDVKKEHRTYCPWINKISQASDHAGWELVSILHTKPERRPSHTSVADRFSFVKKMLARID